MLALPHIQEKQGAQPQRPDSLKCDNSDWHFKNDDRIGQIIIIIILIISTFLSNLLEVQSTVQYVCNKHQPNEQAILRKTNKQKKNNVGGWLKG